MALRRKFYRKPENTVRRNHEIPHREIRLVDEDGEQVGIVKLGDALVKAHEAELDLVEIAPKAEPPVCRIMDYGKFVFEQRKKQHAAKKNQKQVHVKEVKFRPGTDTADYEVKLRNLRKFLEEGDRTKVTLRFRGREMAHQELGHQLLKRVEGDLDELATVEQRPKMEGRVLTMMLAPKKG